jgi:hypothetical protein
MMQAPHFAALPRIILVRKTRRSDAASPNNHN